MLNRFVMNGLIWGVRYTQPNNPVLVDRTGKMTCAVTDPATMTIYLADNLHGEFLNRVLLHELGHVTMYSWGLLDDIHRMVKKAYWIEAEEWICNFIADYGAQVFGIAYSVLGDEAIHIVPYHMGRLVA